MAPKNGAKRMSASVDNFVHLSPFLARGAINTFMVDYDKDADVLYVNFTKPRKSTHGEITEDGVVLNFRGKQLVGITILDASKRGRKKARNG
ncbi:MAG: hypothetical protein A2Z34_04925 [Planctomycetes bacterium RBG_16_59_8]|nr:MAG: hypothetical protein A2Z34_04925 [Planctomycetes bacterium RBG_16_59_8]